MGKWVSTGGCGRLAVASAARLAPAYAGRPLKIYLAGANPANL